MEERSELGQDSAAAMPAEVDQIEKGWSVFDALDKPLGNVADVAGGCLEIDARPQGHGYCTVPLDVVRRTADGHVYLSITTEDFLSGYTPSRPEERPTVTVTARPSTVVVPTNFDAQQEAYARERPSFSPGLPVWLAPLALVAAGVGAYRYARQQQVRQSRLERVSSRFDRLPHEFEMKWPTRDIDFRLAIPALAGLLAGVLYLLRGRLPLFTGSRTLGSIMTGGVQVVAPDSTCFDASMLMRRLDVGAIPVCDGLRLRGMVTDRDIVVRCIAAGRDPRTTVVRDVMTPEVIWAYDGDPVEKGAALMRQHQIRRLPIVNRDKDLVGIVSLGDLAVDTGRDQLSGETLEQISEPARPAR